MIQHIFTVFDSKAAAYLQPFYASTKGVAIRQFSDAVNDPGHQFARHGEDYTLFELGHFDDQNAQFHLHSTPLSIGVAVEFTKENTDAIRNETRLLKSAAGNNPQG